MLLHEVALSGVSLDKTLEVPHILPSQLVVMIRARLHRGAKQAPFPLPRPLPPHPLPSLLLCATLLDHVLARPPPAPDLSKGPGEGPSGLSI